MDHCFPECWIGRRGPVEWPTRSPDLTPLDFFLWGYLKNLVYVDRPKTVDELTFRIKDECQKISTDTLKNVSQGFVDRLGLAADGAHFEQLIRSRRKDRNWSPGSP